MENSLEVYVLQCGQGDTILVRLPPEKWILIDCNLPPGAAREAFFDFVRQRSINKLALVCLTHAHDDHYTGMEEVLRYFNESGRSVLAFCDSGVEPGQIVNLFKRRKRPPSSISEYEKLYLQLDSMLKSKNIKYLRADQNSMPVIRCVGSTFEAQLLPIGPRPEVFRNAVLETLSSERIKTDLNRISVVLAVVVGCSNRRFDGLLAADTDGEGFNAALEKLREKAHPFIGFDFAKVAHHGSLHSHKGSTICVCRKESTNAAAAISANHSGVLPDRNVIKDFLNHGWTVLLTTKRLPSDRQFALQLASVKMRPPELVQQFSLEVRWDPTAGLFWSPPEAAVKPEDLDSFGTAQK